MTKGKVIRRTIKIKNKKEIKQLARDVYPRMLL